MSEKPEESNNSFEELVSELGLSPLDEYAYQMYEMYESLLRAGFHERQALILLAIIMSEDNASEAYYVRDDEDPEEEPTDGK